MSVTDGDRADSYAPPVPRQIADSVRVRFLLGGLLAALRIPGYVSGWGSGWRLVSPFLCRGRSGPGRHGVVSHPHRALGPAAFDLLPIARSGRFEPGRGSGFAVALIWQQLCHIHQDHPERNERKAAGLRQRTWPAARTRRNGRPWRARSSTGGPGSASRPGAGTDGRSPSGRSSSPPEPPRSRSAGCRNSPSSPGTTGQKARRWPAAIRAEPSSPMTTPPSPGLFARRADLRRARARSGR